MTPLQRERERRGLTKAKMAELIGVDRASYGRYEDMTNAPSVDKAKDIAQRLGNALTRDQLLYPEDYATPVAEPVLSRTEQVS